MDHHGIPFLADWMLIDGQMWLVYKRIEGKPLSRFCGQEVAEGRLIYWARQLADILVYLHGQKPFPLIHRDIKPDNILVDPQDHIWLIDYGAAVQGNLSSLGKALPLGTPGFAAPEQYFRPMDIGTRTDIYSFGATLNAVIGDGWKTTSIPLRKIIKGCTAIQPAKRFPDFCTISDLLQSL